MEYLHNGYTLELSQGAFPLSTDSVALAHFVQLPKKASVLDLGSGCGTLGLMLCAKDPSCSVTGVEIDEKAHEMALHNARSNECSHRLSSICADVAQIPAMIKAGSFSCCVSNPPYFSGGPQSKTHPLARQEAGCTLETIFRAAGWSLQWGGDFFLVHRPERLAQICACAAQNQMEAKRLLLLRHRSDGPVSLILVQCRKGAKPGLIWEERSLHDADGQPSPYYNELYHI